MEKIVVIIPSYNNRRWYRRNLSSVLAQHYDEFRAIYIDDCSSDDTGQLVERFIAEHNSGDLIKLIHNPRRVGALQNQYNAIHSCADDEIVILLDGDDWLAHDGVLGKINEMYTSTNCWMTYGQYQSWPDNMFGFSAEITFDVIKANSFRQDEWRSSHLRSFYAWLFKSIRKADLLDPNGAFYQMTSDQAIMFPMLEMSGPRAKFIGEVLYIYNAANPINDHKIDRQLQRDLEMKIRAQTPYPRLHHPLRTGARNALLDI